MELERFVDACNDFFRFEYGNTDDEQLLVEDVKTFYPKVNLLYTYVDKGHDEYEMQVDYDTARQQLVVCVLSDEYRKDVPIEDMTSLLNGWSAWDELNGTALDLLEKEGFFS
jgi:hypothetical protein